MSPDPLRALDRIDPPEQWDEIARRAGSADGDVDLAAPRVIRPRRRAATLVAAAAVVALVAGGIAATRTGDADGEGVTATDVPDGPAMEGLCPFTLDPEAVPAALVPGTGRPPVPAYTWSWRQPAGADLSVPGSWGTVDYGGIPVTISVYRATATPQESGVTTSLPDDPAVIDVVAWGPVDGATGACATAEVRVRLPLTDEDRQRRAAGDEITGGDYLSDPVPPRILHAVRLIPWADHAATPDPSTPATTAPVAAVPGACPFTLAPDTDLPALDPGRTPVDTAGVAPAEDVVTWGHLDVDAVSVEVAVSGTAGEPSIRSDQPQGVGPVVVDVFSDAPRVTVEAWEVVADEGPCSTLTVYAHVPLRPEDAALGEPPVDGRIPTDADLAPYVDIARPVLERVRDAVVLLPERTTPTTEPGDREPR